MAVGGRRSVVFSVKKCGKRLAVNDPLVSVIAVGCRRRSFFSVWVDLSICLSIYEYRPTCARCIHLDGFVLCFVV